MSTAPLPDTLSAAADRHGHRFLLIGRKTVFSYHLGLYHVPIHAFQLITAFGLSDQLRTTYLDDLAAHEDQQVYYSLFTEGHWPLQELVDGTRTSLPVELERVTVDAEGRRTFTPLLPAVEVGSRKEDVVHYRPLVADADYPDLLTELVFGRDDEVHLAHALAGAPNWDEVITTVDPQGFRPTDLAPAATLTVPSVKDPHGAAPKSPLTPGDRYEAKIGERALTFTAGRRGWWNNTSLNAQ
ncbi:hypothetical protein HUT16_02240 [Kitasatospora sp. NA04385]|uniref:hypothetical protein n=1 Tax=Kitasatospora sp. NA04385 TaxID=2742135 RepID=UPI0015918A7B|nr:hypothetical protein [Kitasatospora sp. NA04385]QKW18040.1 hypothetical protein HUT16_02240 [Kitasatospora sp. NA04385]